MTENDIHLRTERPVDGCRVTWLKGKKNIHVFVEPGGSHRAHRHTARRGKEASDGADK